MHQDERWLAWYVQTQMNARLVERLSDDMERALGFPAAWFDVLANLCDTPRRMNELADELILSRGGATRLVTRMEEAGFVERQTPPTDRRATFAVLTARGRDAFDKALPIHLELVQECFSRHLEPEDAEALIAVAQRVCAAHGWPEKTQASPGSSTPSSSQV
jgi:DNA-binding MarR family transcriptional regulator